MSTYDDHLAAAREVQFAMQLSREQMAANDQLSPPARLVSEDFHPHEPTAAALARRSIRQISNHDEFWRTTNPTTNTEGGRPYESPLLYGIGSRAAFDTLRATPGLIITGPRRPTASTAARTAAISAVLAKARVPLIAGLSNGTETTALRMYLDRAPDLVTIVLGSSPLIAYPTNQRELHKRAIASGGAVISRTPHPAPPIRHSEHLRDLTRVPLARAALVTETRPAPSTTDSFIQTAQTNSLSLFTFSTDHQVPEEHRADLPQIADPYDLSALIHSTLA